MSAKKTQTAIAITALIAICILLMFKIFPGSDSENNGKRDNIPAVAVAPIEKRAIELRRVFSGALEARSKFVVAPKVAGRVTKIPVDISDTVMRGDIVAILDDAEFTQNVNQAEADLAVADANLVEASSSFEITQREHQRTTTLRERGIASESEYDNAQAALLAKNAQLKVAEAQVTRAKSSLESARIRLGYTTIAANWSEGDDHRVVAERYIDEGETVSANEPLLLIVDLSPITAVIYVTERDYGLLKPGMEASFAADSFPGKSFSGNVERISPVFRENSRQARVELSIDNPESNLKPGMFVRASIALKREDTATIIPYAALTRRGDDQGVFIANTETNTVKWQTVETGIRSGEWIQVLDNSISGSVVTLGQHLVDDGSSIVIPDGVPINITQ